MCKGTDFFRDIQLFSQRFHAEDMILHTFVEKCPQNVLKSGILVELSRNFCNFAPKLGYYNQPTKI